MVSGPPTLRGVYWTHLVPFCPTQTWGLHPPGLPSPPRSAPLPGLSPVEGNEKILSGEQWGSPARADVLSGRALGLRERRGQSIRDSGKRVGAAAHARLLEAGGAGPALGAGLLRPETPERSRAPGLGSEGRTLLRGR